MFIRCVMHDVESHEPGVGDTRCQDEAAMAVFSVFPKHGYPSSGGQVAEEADEDGIATRLVPPAGHAKGQKEDEAAGQLASQVVKPRFLSNRMVGGRYMRFD